MSNTIMGWFLPDRIEMNRLLIAGIFLFIGFVVASSISSIKKKRKIALDNKKESGDRLDQRD